MRFKKIVSTIVSAALCASLLAGCGGNAANTSKAAGTQTPAASSRPLIKVGIINNDPKESGYRTANDKDLKATFCEINGFDAYFAYDQNNDGQCNPFQSSYIKDIIDTLESGGTITQKTIIMTEKGFDASTITQDDIDNYGI